MLPLKLHRYICCSSKFLLPTSKQFAANLSSLSQKESFSSAKYIISDENKQRVQSKLTSVEPFHSTNFKTLKDEFVSAAVLIPMCLVNDEPSLLLTLRSSKLTSHKGQVSFPGGHVDEDDSDVSVTALRETKEELGIPHSAFDVWGQLNPLPSGDRKTLIYPIIARTGEIDVSNLRINENEVEEVFTVTLEHLCHADNVGATRFRSESSYTLPVYTGATHRIWGLTAVIIHQALSLIAHDMYQFKIRHKKPYTPR